MAGLTHSAQRQGCAPTGFACSDSRHCLAIESNNLGCGGENAWGTFDPTTQQVRHAGHVVQGNDIDPYGWIGNPVFYKDRYLFAYTAKSNSSVRVGELRVNSNVKQPLNATSPGFLLSDDIGNDVVWNPLSFIHSKLGPVACATDQGTGKLVCWSLLSRKQVYSGSNSVQTGTIDFSFCAPINDDLYCTVAISTQTPGLQCAKRGLTSGLFLVHIDIQQAVMTSSPIHSSGPYPMCMWNAATFGRFGATFGAAPKKLYAAVEYQVFTGSAPPQNPINYVGYFEINEQTHQPMGPLTQWSALPRVEVASLIPISDSQ